MTMLTPIRREARDFTHAMRVADEAQQAGDCETALAIYRAVLAHAPRFVEGQAKMARALFCLRRWREAWRAFDVRFELMASPPVVNARGPGGLARPIPRTADGPPPARLLVLSEQGMGDTIQFCRFLPKMLEAGLDVQVVVPQRLIGLLRTLEPCPPLLPVEEQRATSELTAWTTMMDLPLLLDLEEEDYLAREPYLKPEQQRVARWRDWLGERDGPVIAFAWRGNPEHKLDPARSATLEDLAPLADIPGATLICLQHNATDEEIAACSFGAQIRRPGPDFDSGLDAFLDSAALLTLVDTLVCVDTSLIHVAGALHAHVDMMITHDWADWRWIDRDDFNVWYPTLRLWRRARDGSYRNVAARIAQDIMDERGG